MNWEDIGEFLVLEGINDMGLRTKECVDDDMSPSLTGVCLEQVDGYKL